jgi:hypothetical protein
MCYQIEGEWMLFGANKDTEIKGILYRLWSIEKEFIYAVYTYFIVIWFLTFNPSLFFML